MALPKPRYTYPIPVTRMGAPPPWKHQEVGYAKLCQHDGYGLWMDMGTGKSRIVIDYLNNRDVSTVLILCPLSVIDAWVKQFDIYGAKAYYVLPLRDNWSVRRKVEECEKAQVLAYHQKRPLVIITNYEAAWRPPFGPIYDATGTRQIAEGFALSLDWDVVVCDEIHRIKDPNGRASRFVAALAKVAQKRVGLSGTPMPHSPLDLFAIYRFLDPRVFGDSFFAFKHHYAIEVAKEAGGKRWKEITGYKNQDEMQAKMYSIAYRVKASDVLDLPPAIHMERTTTLEPAAQKMYRQLYTRFIVELDAGVVTASNALVKLLRLQQLTSGFLNDETGMSHEVSEAKKRLLMDTLEDLPDKEPVVVFAHFKHDLDTVKRVCQLQKRRYCELSGRTNELAAWQGGAADVIGVQLQAGGVGVDLSRAAQCIYYSLGFSLGTYDQSLARCHRPGQLRPVLYTHLLVNGTVDGYVYAALREKRDVVEAILEGIREEGVHAA